MLVFFVYDIVPYQESTTLQLYPTAAAVGNTTYVRSQMTDKRQHAESITLQLYPTKQHPNCGNDFHNWAPSGGLLTASSPLPTPGLVSLPIQGGEYLLA